MRKQIKKPLTDRAIVLALNELEKLAPGDLDTQRKILDQSTISNWQGLFPLKGDSSHDAGKGSGNIFAEMLEGKI